MHLTALHEQWACLGMQRHTHITGNNLICSLSILHPVYFTTTNFMFITWDLAKAEHNGSVSQSYAMCNTVLLCESTSLAEPGLLLGD